MYDSLWQIQLVAAVKISSLQVSETRERKRESGGGGISQNKRVVWKIHVKWKKYRFLMAIKIFQYFARLCLLLAAAWIT